MLDSERTKSARRKDLKSLAVKECRARIFRANRITAAWAEQKIVREIMVDPDSDDEVQHEPGDSPLPSSERRAQLRPTNIWR
jgi:hypothetical protein